MKLVIQPYLLYYNKLDLLETTEGLCSLTLTLKL